MYSWQYFSSLIYSRTLEKTSRKLKESFDGYWTALQLLLLRTKGPVIFYWCYCFHSTISWTSSSGDVTCSTVHSKAFVITDYFKHMSLKRIEHFYSTSNVPSVYSVYSNTANAYSTTAHPLHHLLSRHRSFFSNRLNQLSCYKIAVWYCLCVFHYYYN